MDEKSITNTLYTTFDNFCNSITDRETRELVKYNTIITGGCIPSMLMNENVNDFDLYFKNRKTVIAVANYYVDYFKKLKEKQGIYHNTISVDTSNNDSVSVNLDNNACMVLLCDNIYDFYPSIETFENLSKSLLRINNYYPEANYMPLAISKNAITLSNKIQLVTRFYGNVAAIHKTFDYEHDTCYWDSGSRQLILPYRALQSIASKNLKYTGTWSPICSLFRAQKFIKRGWSISSYQLLNIALQINKLDLSKPEVLAEQLTGMYSLQFSELVSVLMQDSRSGKTLTIDYINKLINTLGED